MPSLSYETPRKVCIEDHSSFTPFLGGSEEVNALTQMVPPFGSYVNQRQSLYDHEKLSSAVNLSGLARMSLNPLASIQQQQSNAPFLKYHFPLPIPPTDRILEYCNPIQLPIHNTLVPRAIRHFPQETSQAYQRW